MKEVIECPYGEGSAILKKVQQKITFRKEEFSVIAHFYVCEACGEEFTTNETDQITLIQAHNQYREKHGIPFIDEIKEIREKYDLSAAKMSQILGLGENGYANYEKGEMPTPAIGRLIKAAGRPSSFLEFYSGQFQSTPDKSLIKARLIAEKLSIEKKPYHFFELLNNHNDPNNYTGYVALNTSKIKLLLVHFIRSCEHEFNDKLKLSKLLFFTDFYHYKHFGRSVSGLSYKKMDIGPVPMCYDHFFTYFEHQHVIKAKWEEVMNGRARELVITNRHDSIDEIFNEQEISTIIWITSNYKDAATWDMVAKSRFPNIKVNTQDHDHLIGFQENAFDFADV
jgi:putative zinc finger/helix-turn-helix YgiT family protein